ncbi:MAG: epoxyqueuosine reductase QueH [Oscillospiraceae bacterium]|nr:epoxyqueuosine reductase QueH [Oscillospiraceae bacterium]
MFKNNKKTLLLHSCCAPCSTTAIERLKDSYEIALYYYNPNIMPAAEYEKRLAEQRRFASIQDLELFTGEYETDIFIRDTKGLEDEREGGERCRRCIALRLNKTAQAAISKGFESIATTLSVSPHKNTALINTILSEIGRCYTLNPLLEDFKKKDGFKKSLELSKKYGLYRQSYCGCVFSRLKK